MDSCERCKKCDGVAHFTPNKHVPSEHVHTSLTNTYTHTFYSYGYRAHRLVSRLLCSRGRLNEKRLSAGADGRRGDSSTVHSERPDTPKSVVLVPRGDASAGVDAKRGGAVGVMVFGVLGSEGVGGVSEL